MLADNDGDAVAAAPPMNALAGEEKDTPSLSPEENLRHVFSSPGASPTISALDGTPLHLFSVSLPAPPSPALPSPPSPDMAIQRADAPREDHGLPHEDHTAAAPASDPVPLTVADPLPVMDARPDVVPSLAHISRLLRSREYEIRKCFQVQEELHGLQIANARSSRLLRTAPAIQRTLAECIRIEDKAGFANLFNACHDAMDACSGSLPPGCGEELTDPAETPYLAGSFLQELSTPARATVLDVLSSLRYDSDFIADRLANLTSLELNALLPDRSSGGLGDSVLGGARSLSRTSKPLGFVVDAQADILASQSYASALETLVHASRDVSTVGASDWGSLLDVWSSVSARLIRERRPGGERLIPALFDMWSSFLPWPGKERLEAWIMRTVQRGATLLDHQTKRSFRARDPGRPDASAEEETRMLSFLNGAADSLLELLGSREQPSIIPPGALMLCHAIWSKLSVSPDHQRAFPQFVISRWLHSFVLEVVTLPEAHDILTDFYISDTVRQRILREIAVRSQRAIFDVVYSWKYGINPHLETVQRVQGIMLRFQGAHTDARFGAHHGLKPVHDKFAILSINDVCTILKALYPLRRPASIMSDRETLRSGIYSSASSVSGFSMFRNLDRVTVTPDASSESPRTAPSEMHCLSGTEPVGIKAGLAHGPHDGQLLPDNEQVREVCFELDDLAASVTPSSPRFWAVLVEDPSLHVFCTLAERHACLNFSDHVPMNKLVDRESLNIAIRCAESLRVLIQEYGFDAPVDGAEDMQHIRRQLISLFERAIEESQNNSEFVQAHHWVCSLQEFHLINSHTDWLRLALEQMVQRTEDMIIRASDLSGACGEWLRRPLSLAQLKQKHLQPLAQLNTRLRDKMWYIADVRTSAAYDEARIVASALRIMGKPKKLQYNRVAAPLRNWTGPRLANGNLHLKSESQVLELLSARLEHGGPNKLSDEQSKATLAWLENQNIINLCKGEERLHRLCMEIRKCVEQTCTPSAMESSMILSDSLFSRDQVFHQPAVPSRGQSLLAGSYGLGSHGRFMSLGDTTLQRPGTSSSASRSLSAASSRDRLDTRSPALTNRSSLPFWSPAMTEIKSSSSVTSMDSFHTQSHAGLRPYQSAGSNALENQTTSDKLRQHLTSLLLSDLSANMYSEGSETDLSFWSGLGRDLSEKHLGLRCGPLARIEQGAPAVQDGASHVPPVFDFKTAFEKLLIKFSATLNPFRKLHILFDIEGLLGPMLEHMHSGDPATSPLMETLFQQQSALVNRQSVRGFVSIFSESSLRPLTIFRDLQYIASLVPLPMLEGTRMGGAFCNAAVAMCHLRQELRSVMVATADNIIAYYANNRGGGRSSSAAQQQRDFATFSSTSPIPPAEDIARYSMADAAHLLQICAKEGEPAAQRELATLYLTNPELVGHILEPFARPRDVFKEELESKWRKNQDPKRCDPMTMCVAHHWMSLSSKGGDALAKEFLRQREEMDRLP